jgi:phosphoribosylglycinamide formyltransferase-1
LPKYTGLHTHQRALDAGDKQHGLSIHFVTPELDGGPVILQALVTIDEGETETSLKDKIHQQEHVAYPLAVEWFAQGRLSFKDHQAWLDQKILKQPQVLSTAMSSSI